PCSVFIHAGNETAGAVAGIEHICKGRPLQPAAWGKFIKGGGMKTTFLCLLMAGVFASASCRAFELTSPDFTDGSQLPTFSSCDSSGTAPGLVWSHPPAGTKSFALTCIDPDAPKGDFLHWIVYDIPATAAAIPPGGRVPAGSRELASDYGRPGYGPACPPSGTHRYIFTLYALNTDKINSATRDEFFKAIKRTQIGTAALTGLYKRKQ
ncbi:MAG: YbhB/YbcL family Raf kinase inhibitor-like protein, partial [Proteobacteria bacterium]|nr:YbhB/YbcL family Raf kinase inhibitor-like protein [Pseudomonadota bacterium]